MVTQEAVFTEAKRRSEEMLAQTQNRVTQLRKAGNEYMDDALRRTEDTIAQALEEVRETRTRFRTVTEAQEQRMEQRRQSNIDMDV